MNAQWSAIAFSFALAGALTLIGIRLRMYDPRESAGRYPFFFGGTLLLLAAVWQVFASSPDYPKWFVITAYGAITITQVTAGVLGLALVTMALVKYGDFQRARRSEVETLEGKLSILENLQQDARSPYQLLEILNLTLKEILVHFPGCPGAVFLVNRGKRQLVLGTSVGMSKNETAGLERYPLGRNMITQVIEETAPVIAGAFEFVDEQDRHTQSRFESTLILPLVTGAEKIGAIVLLAQPARAFGRTDVRFLAPVAQWLSERIHGARLVRDLALAGSERDHARDDMRGLVSRLQAASKALQSDSPADVACRALVGLHESSTIHYCGLTSGRLEFHGSSEPIDELSEGFRTALIDALDRRKALIINQETTDSDGRSRVVRSNLVCPLDPVDSSEALLLRREGAPFSVGDQDLAIMRAMGLIVRAALRIEETERRDISRRVGFEKVVSLLSGPGEKHTFSDDNGFLVRRLGEMLPPSSAALTLVRWEDGSLVADTGIGFDRELLKDLIIEPGEGIAGKAAAAREHQYAAGKKNVLAAVESFQPENRQLFNHLFGERRMPAFCAFCPVVQLDAVQGLVVAFIFDLPESEASEWERLLTLATGLYSMRLTVDALRRSKLQAATGAGSTDTLMPVINELNNHLSAVIGTAELAARQEQASGEVRTELGSIIAEAEKAATLLKSVAADSRAAALSTPPPPKSLDDVVGSVLQAVRISGDLYMAGGRAREIDQRLGSVGPVVFSSESVRQLFEGVLDRFAASATEEDIITVATYEKGHYVYLDISRHRKNFPPVDRVSHFGEYQLAEQALEQRPSDVFLTSIADGVCFYAYDRVGIVPAYLSFKFPVKGTQSDSPATGRGSTPTRVLAIDDQALILDLIAAMGQSMGYEVSTAQTGEAGLRLAAGGRYDVILADLAMPDLSGLEVARQIHRMHPETPIVLITGWGSGIDQNQLAAAGIQQVLYKPFRIEQLTDIVKSAAESGFRPSSPQK